MTSVFVAMPFGRKFDVTKSYEIDFDVIYERGIKAALEPLAGIHLIRADEERGGGFIHIPMFARLLLAEVTIVDVTVENANVFYELGVRHTARPKSTIIITAREGALPFDIAALRALPYKLEDGVLTEPNAEKLRVALLQRVREALGHGEKPDDDDSPLFQLFKGYPGVALDAASIDPNFETRAVAAQQLRSEIAGARALKPSEAAVTALRGLVDRVADVPVDPALVQDLMLALRGHGAYDDVVALYDRTPDPLRTTPHREQYALALSKRNRPGERDLAIAILTAMNEKLPSSETAGLIGSAYKSSMDEALAANDELMAEDHRERAISWYRLGFETDPRDYYPGIVLLELLLVSDDPKKRDEFEKTLPVVEYAVERKGGAEAKDYWVAATALQLAIFGNNWTKARIALRTCVALAGTSHDYLSTSAKSFRRIADANLSTIDGDELARIIAEMDKRVLAATTGAK